MTLKWASNINMNMNLNLNFITPSKEDHNEQKK